MLYLYGSFTEAEEYRDLDIAVYSKAGYDALRLSTDLKIALHEHTGMSPDFFDVRVINGILDHGDLFSLLYLKHIFAKNELLLDKDLDRRTDFIEKYNMKYRDVRLWRRFSKIEKLDPKEKRRIMMLLDTFIEKDRLRERAKTA
ncbi:MAG: hypothetical protein LWX08_14890 [Deltaproteobacteria bacterium]|nr:hypothetical protein [Deltaproteobacteria bacterium]